MRTRGKRQRYTYDEEEDFDSDNLSARRSGRQSARDTPAAPSGPTVTASGRHVRSRATGLYGETLHSGQVTDHGSSVNGDYVRSDMSEEPQLGHGRATRAANRGTTNDRALGRTFDSEDDEDATSWDGGDDDEEEADQMDLDDNEHDAPGDLSEEGDEQQSLIVTLHYRKGASDASAALDHEDTVMTNGVDDETATSKEALAQPSTATVLLSNCLPASSEQPAFIPTTHQPPANNTDALPKLDGFFSAPTPPYSAPDEAPQPQQQPLIDVSPTSISAPPPHSAPTPTASWQ